jgi:murein DD-endopeptidase MepM/ murein hydrolase activator NlpD
MTRRAPSVPVLIVSALMVCVLGAQRASRPSVIVAAPQAPPAVAVAVATAEPIINTNSNTNGEWPSSLQQIEPDYLLKAPLLHTEVPKRPRREIITYNIIGGDTIVGIAKKFGISPESILWANERTELSPDFLRIGQELIIPPTTGVLHEVKAGDTIESIAKKYKADSAAIVALEVNALTPPFALSVGQKIMVPGGEKPYTPKVVYGYSGPVPENATRGSGNFVWPISGVVTQEYWTGHRAIDIGARIGSQVKAADSGFVVLVASDDAGYGKHIIINHGNGFETLYAHLTTILVSPGQSVGRGQVIALSGSTGRSTGPHLHFEIRYLGVQRNPFGYLP